MAFDHPGLIDNFKPGQLHRATEGIQKLFDQNTGDGTIVAVGFLGSEMILQSLDKIARKRGKKGIDPTIRFLSSVAFGTVLAGWLETTKFMNNTIDVPGDWFGVGLGAAAILTTKIIADNATEANFDKFFTKSTELFQSVTQNVNHFGEMVQTSIDRLTGVEDVDSAAQAIAARVQSIESDDEAKDLKD
jgi:hypothetical protein